VDLLAQLAVNGVVAGSLYALLGVSFGLIYGPTRIVHFGHGSVYAAGAYAAWFAAVPLALPLWLALPFGVVAGGVLGVLCYVLVYWPLERRGSAPLVILITSLGLFILLENLIGISFGSDTKTVAAPTSGVVVLGPVVVTWLQLGQVAASLVGILALMLVLRLSGFGRTVRAITDNPEMARTIGIDTRRVSSLVFLIGSMLCAMPAGIVLLMNGAQPQMGLTASFIGYVVVMVGGVGSLWGAAIAGLLLGLVEHVGMWQLPTEWQSTIAFALLVVVLLVRPRGLISGRA
jgi:branched-chain amino acid transport system permease protein